MLLPKTSSARAPSVGAERVEELVRRPAGARQRRGVHAPDRRHVRPRGRVVDHPVAGQLVGLLAVLAPALAVALAGEAAVAGVRAAAHAERERHVDPAEHRGGALGVLFGAACGQHRHPLGAGEQVGQLAQLGDRDAADPLDALGPPGRRAAAHLVEAGGPGRDVLLVDGAGGVEQVQQPEGQCQVCARHRLEEEVGPLGGRGEPRVDDHDPAAPLAEPVEVARGRRHGLGEVRPDQDHDVGLLDVGERERQPAVDPEGLVAGGGRRRHAPAAVVVDLAGAQRDPGQLAELVGLLVGEPTTAEDRDRVRAGLLAQLAQPVADQVQGLVPRRGAELTGGPVAHERRGEALAVPVQPGRGPALAAERALVDRELRPRAAPPARDALPTSLSRGTSRTGGCSTDSGCRSSVP